MQSSTSAEPYSSASVLHITFTKDFDAIRNSAHLAEAWREYGFEVSEANEKDLGLIEGHVKTSCRNAAKYFRDWLKGEESSAGEGKKLLVVCYIGHGYVKEESRWQNSHLFGIRYVEV